MDTRLRRKISALLLATLFFSWGAVLAFADVTPHHAMEERN